MGLIGGVQGTEILYFNVLLLVNLQITMKLLSSWTLLFFGLFLYAPLQGQTLQITSMDSLVRGNSTHTGIITGHITVKNTATVTNNYFVKRAKVGQTAAFVDSNYFCWDLCYPYWVNQSQGTVTIAPGQTASDFSAYVYLPANGVAGQDTIWYTFFNAANASDSLRTFIVWSIDASYSHGENSIVATRAYPQPAGLYVTFDFSLPSRVEGSLSLVDLHGRSVMQKAYPSMSTRLSLSTAELPQGQYFAVREEEGLLLARIPVWVVR